MGSVGWFVQDFFVIHRPSTRYLTNKKKKSRLRINSCVISFFVCDPCRIQTCNPHIRSVVLYSVELTDHCFFSKASAKVLLFFDMTKYFGKKMQNNLILLLFVVLSEQNKRYFFSTYSDSRLRPFSS